MGDDIRMRFFYLKSNAFRVVHVDGVIGGPTPSGLLHASLFSERAPLPTMVEHAVDDLGGGKLRLGAEVSKESKDGFVREVEVGLMMSLDKAKQLRDRLDRNIEKVEAMISGKAAPDGP